MKKFCFFMFTSLIFLLIFSGCATKKMTYLSRDYELYGSWINPDYYAGNRPGCMVFALENKFEEWDTHEQKSLRGQFWYDITSRWTDRSGSVWYTVIYLMHDGSHSYQLIKLSDSGKTLEGAFSATDYPNEINLLSMNTSYSIYYREE